MMNPDDEVIDSSNKNNIHRPSTPDRDNNSYLPTTPPPPILRKRSKSGGTPNPKNQNNINTDNDQPDENQSSQSTIPEGGFEDEETSPDNNSATAIISQHDLETLQKFWSTYDTIIILSIFAIFGIAFRMASATWFRLEWGSVFSEDSALGTNLPLNIGSCFLFGLLCSGRDAMGIVHSKVMGGAIGGRGMIEAGRGAYRGVVDAGRAGINRAHGYGNGHRLNRESSASESTSSDNMQSSTSTSNNTNGLHRQHGIAAAQPTSDEDPTTQNATSNHQSNNGESIVGLLGLGDEYGIAGSEDEIRDVQLRGLTRRIMASPSLVLFAAKKEDSDIMEHYETGNQLSSPRNQSTESQEHFEIGELDENNVDVEASGIEMREVEAFAPSPQQNSNAQPRHLTPSRILRQTSSHVDEIVQNISAIRRVHVMDGWSIGTSAENMKDIILVGLRVGFCGALSTFSSLNASMISLLRAGSFGEALFGYALSIQMGIISYRFGQHLAVYIFVWRCRREAKRDERRGGYGLRLRRMDTGDLENEDNLSVNDINPSQQQRSTRRRFISVRMVATLLLAAMIITLGLAVYFFSSHQQYLLSLLFTPLGTLARYKLMKKYNSRVPGFPVGTFICNIGGCALSGSLGSFLAGNPAPEERIVLTSLIAGFAGSLSTFAAFIVEILSLIDPIIFKFDGLIYASITILWAVIIGFIGSQAKNWADEI